MSKVFVIDTNKQPLDPVHPGRARLLLSSGKAADIKTAHIKAQGISHSYCHSIHQSDGYNYRKGESGNASPV